MERRGGGMLDAVLFQLRYLRFEREGWSSLLRGGYKERGYSSSLADYPKGITISNLIFPNEILKFNVFFFLFVFQIAVPNFAIHFWV